MKKIVNNINQDINGNNNIQVAGDYIKTEKVVKTTQVIHNPDEHITDAQAKEIRDKVKKVAEEMAGERKYSSSPYGAVYTALYNRYKITKYTLLPKDKYEDAIKWLDKQIAIYRPKLKNVDPEQYRKDMYKSIHARANQLHINIHEYAANVLELKKPISSLKELSDTRLKKVYTKLFSK
ncbi:hypothetical protein HMPREF1214_04175 [Bacteroides sp. HPS0048]|uniref:hypothetical protein n=1 Tax=Bacteroides sp. HPS0048 TaxID=1078089 RepID=UPI000377F126|nr:hypothetical protein [Bacteroides sp. HPS0048]EOA54211.1 hypothetical protein HMPREF1214_04175 [Bacteroides sp. HPS0048]